MPHSLHLSSIFAMTQFNTGSERRLVVTRGRSLLQISRVMPTSVCLKWRNSPLYVGKRYTNYFKVHLLIPLSSPVVFLPKCQRSPSVAIITNVPRCSYFTKRAQMITEFCLWKKAQTSLCKTNLQIVNKNARSDKKYSYHITFSIYFIGSFFLLETKWGQICSSFYIVIIISNQLSNQIAILNTWIFCIFMSDLVFFWIFLVITIKEIFSKYCT